MDNLVVHFTNSSNTRPSEKIEAPCTVPR